MARPIVVVGASVAGVRTVQALRGVGFDGGICLVGDEAEWPYDKPPLSKQVLTAGTMDQRMRLLEGSEANRLGVDVRLGTRAVGVDPDRPVVHLADGTTLPFAALVLATGAAATTAPWASCSDGVFTLRSLADAFAISKAFDLARDVAVVGAGLIGMEVASSARSRGLAVTVVDIASGPLMRVVGTEVSARLTAWYAGQGVRLLFNRAVESIGTADDRRVVRLAGGESVVADCVVVAIGARPNVGWLAGSHVPVGDGVLTDETGLVDGDRGIYAVGDVAAWWHPAVARHVRHEHWTRTVEQAPCLAHNICHPDDRRTVTTPAYSWSDQFGSKLQMIGRVGQDETRFVTGAGPDRWAALSGSDGEFVGATFMNWPRGLASARTALAARAAVEDVYEKLA